MRRKKTSPETMRRNERQPSQEKGSPVKSTTLQHSTHNAAEHMQYVTVQFMQSSTAK